MATDWAALRTAAGSTETGARLASELEQRKLGAGPPHTDASLRLFGKSEADVRVTRACPLLKRAAPARLA